ncbi:hypothetical protein [Agromyces badenianii]|uniref:hypothetical protein n=1 Tax=Agromyces badenianii TaxID=2080742 RepID=UPI00105A8CCF|nr:hypothetical protein [Agromyces badenianii]
MTGEPRLSPERRADMEQWLTGHIRARRRRRRNLAIVGAVGAGAVSLGLAAWIVLAPREVQERWVDCYAAADLDSAHAGAARSNSDPLEDRDAIALAMCADMWERGLVDGAPHEEAPELALCMRPDRSLAAFPRNAAGVVETDRDLCAGLGLRTPTPAAE